jgi:hypothetical protein
LALGSEWRQDEAAVTECTPFALEAYKLKEGFADGNAM